MSESTAKTLLERQLKKHGLGPTELPRDQMMWIAFIERIIRTYSEHDEARLSSENILEVSLKEMERLQEILSESNQQKLKEVNEHLSAIFNGAPVGIFEVDDKLRIIEVNQTAIEMLGYTKEDLKTKTAYDITHKDDLLKTQEAADDVARHGNSRIEKRYIAKDGSIVWCRVTAKTEAQLPRRIVTFENITHLVAAKEKLKQAELVSFNASKLASLGEMAGGIAHEINNPLGIIQGRATQLLRLFQSGTITPNVAIEGLNKIISTSVRIAKIVKGMKSFSRNAEKDPFAPVILPNLVENIVSICTERFMHGGVKLDVSPVPEVALTCRSVQVEQVLLNLLNNAFDAVTELSEKWVRIEFRTFENKLQISIIDSGKGIPENVLEKLMEPFFTTKEVGKGTGLGLNISKGIVEDHHGELRYDNSTPNTCFVVELPLTQKAED